MIDYLGMVLEFSKKYGHHVSSEICQPPDNIIRLREKLITEETNEFRDASGMLLDDRAELFTDCTSLIADAIGDILVVTFGAALAYGIPIEEVFTEIHRSNMTKSTEKNEYGKTIKGPYYSPPDIKKVLDNRMKERWNS